MGGGEAAALAVLADRRGADLAAVKARSLQTIGRSRLDEARQWLLVNFVQAYLPLREHERQRYLELLAREGHEMARQVQTTWGDSVREEGRLEGLASTMKQMILRALRARFPSVPEELAQQIEAVQDEQVLDRLFDRAVAAAHLDDVRAALLP
jgi:hypothetical protein